MSGLFRYEKAVAGLTAAFVLFAGGWLWNQSRSHGDYRVTVLEREEAAESAGEDRSSGEERPDSLLPGETININTADAYELQRLPGIGEQRAADIVAYRQANGPFGTVEELDKVPGIGEGILEGLREYASVD